MATQTTNQELQEQLDALRKDFAEVASTLKSLTSEYAQQGQDKVKAAAQQAQQQAKESFARAQGEVEAHPYTSMAVAFGIGLVIGKVLDRK
ncbi:DUF883 family protein [Methylophaga sulfidovorans]|uniref:Membrane-anchored ribosome-binding protein, inhibits growth in stationary phase, ElaB/YqjD/DUF883 family n=1 Tax=Methylophaga sulfidovorans TaxID=45496 RepID=A0A1I3WHR0_9GAMM|nr:DUF883 family protein [Methylophaga sulfidovorans]SFK05991.1 Membrane-anchored ribosome-binding protein, inhibits growth in stationary phase, ElaB/YqjD/DUF883 family [Methylophaga sulfidovorans]